MTRTTHTRIGFALGGMLLALLPGAALAFGGGGGDAGSGLSPYAALSGNDRSAGVNNGNYRDPAYDPYVRTYAPEAAARYAAPPGPQPEPVRRLHLRPYYGHRY